MSRRAGETPYPKSLTYAVIVNVTYGAVTLVATVIAFAILSFAASASPLADDSSTLLKVNVIYALCVFLFALIVQSNLGHLRDFLASREGDRGSDVFFSKAFFVSVINGLAISLLVFGTALFLLTLYGVAHVLHLTGG